MKKIVLIAASLFVCFGARAQVVDILNSVEQNNVSLIAQRKLTDAKTLEARTGNSLVNPEVEYSRLWGNASNPSVQGEFIVSQAFDFPTAYIHRAKLARLKSEQYGLEYAAFRQQTLLDAYNLYVEIIALTQQSEFLKKAMDNAVKSTEMMQKRQDAGDAGVLDVNKANYELIAIKNAYQLKMVELSNAAIKMQNLNGGNAVLISESEFPDAMPLLPIDEMSEQYGTSSPQMQAALKGVAVAERDVKVSRSASLPKLSVGFKQAYGAGERANGFVAGISIPMFGNRNNVKRAKAEAEFAEARALEEYLNLHTELNSLYAQADILDNARKEYAALMGRSDSIELLNKALASGHISISEYFAQLQPIYDTYLSMIEMERDYRKVCARINMINL
jgi:outer membrane protein TolC